MDYSNRNRSWNSNYLISIIVLNDLLDMVYNYRIKQLDDNYTIGYNK